MRERGMKAILIGHVPPARTDSKMLWDETCWQKYTLWLQQYRDVVVSGLYGHMNIDHFMLQDTKQIKLLSGDEETTPNQIIRTAMDDELTIESANDYLEELREKWSGLPNPSPAMKESTQSLSKNKKKKKKGKDTKKDKLLKKIGGPWGERFQLTLVSPSLVPNYFPTIRIVEYNITGLDTTSTWATAQAESRIEQANWLDKKTRPEQLDGEGELDDDASTSKKSKKKKPKKQPKKPSNPDLIVPLPPAKSTPPGPAYSPQTFTLLGYTQYFANLTHLNNDNFAQPDDSIGDELELSKWREGKHKGKHPKDKKPHPKPFKFKVEYSTFNDSIYKLPDLTVRNYIKLAHRIGQYKPGKGDSIAEVIRYGDNTGDVEDVHNEDHESHNYDDNDTDEAYDAMGKKHRKKNHHKQKEKNKVWLRFVHRAFVGTLDEEELRTFHGNSSNGAQALDLEQHDGEL
jgi:endopolyphosphatase